MTLIAPPTPFSTSEPRKPSFVDRLFAQLEARATAPMVSEVVTEGDRASLRHATGRDVLAISAATGAGLDRLVQSIATALDRREAAP